MAIHLSNRAVENSSGAISAWVTPVLPWLSTTWAEWAASVRAFRALRIHLTRVTNPATAAMMMKASAGPHSSVAVGLDLPMTSARIAPTGIKTTLTNAPIICGRIRPRKIAAGTPIRLDHCAVRAGGSNGGGSDGTQAGRSTSIGTADTLAATREQHSFTRLRHAVLCRYRSERVRERTVDPIEKCSKAYLLEKAKYLPFHVPLTGTRGSR